MSKIGGRGAIQKSRKQVETKIRQTTIECRRQGNPVAVLFRKERQERKPIRNRGSGIAFKAIEILQSQTELEIRKSE